MDKAMILYSSICGLGLGLLVLSLPSLAAPLVRRVTRGRHDFYNKSIQELHAFDEKVQIYIQAEVIAALLGGAMGYLLFQSVVFSLFGAAMSCLIPSLLIRNKLQQRRSNFELQLPDAITAISSSVKAGLSLVQAIEQVTTDLPAPISQEFGLIIRWHQAGMALDESLRKAQQRLCSRNFNLVCSALMVNRERGGDLSDILEHIAFAIRELYRLEEKLRVETSAPRFEAKVMMCAPLFIVGLFFLFQPDLVHQMLHHPIGIAMIIISSLLMLVAYLWIQKILNEEM